MKQIVDVEIKCWILDIVCEFTFNFMFHDMTLEHMARLSREDLLDMLREAEIGNIM